MSGRPSRDDPSPLRKAAAGGAASLDRPRTRGRRRRRRRRSVRGMDAYLAIVSKRELRTYDARPIEPDAERRILEAGRVSGSSRNRQARRFVVLRSDAARQAAAASVYRADNVLGAALV